MIVHVPPAHDHLGRHLPERSDPVLDRVHRIPGGTAVPDHGMGQPLPALRLAARLGGIAGDGHRERSAPEARLRPMTRPPRRPIPLHPTRPRVGRQPRRTAAREPTAGRRQAQRSKTMTFKEFTGKNVEEAIRTAMAEFSADLGDLDIEILSQGKRGMLGVGGEEARILAAPKSAVDAAETIRAEPDPRGADPRGADPRGADRRGARSDEPMPPRPRRRPEAPGVPRRSRSSAPMPTTRSAELAAAGAYRRGPPLAWRPRSWRPRPGRA